MPHALHRLVLDLSYANGELRATVTHSGPSLAPVQTWAARPVDLADVRNQYGRVTAVLNRANRWGDMDQGSRDLLRQRGRLLFDTVFPTPIKELLRTLAGGELTLVLDEALVFVPWELMHSGGGFLGIDWAVGRVVRTPRSVVGGARPEPDGAWRMLVLCDPRGDLMGSYYEGITLRDELDSARTRLAIDLRSSEVGVGEVKQLIREYDLIHYAGHAEIHPTRPADSGWLLSDGVLCPNDLLDLAGGPSFPRIVFSNACRSGRVDGPLVPSDHGEAIYSVANAFLLSGVHHYIGTLWDVPDEPACHFALAFYEALSQGASLGDATRRARLALCQRYGDDTVLWASYVLYGDPSVRSFAREGVSSSPVRDVPQPLTVARPTAAPHPRPAATRVRGGAAAGSAPTDLGADLVDGLRSRAGHLWPWLALLAIIPIGLAVLDSTLVQVDAPGVTEGPYVRDLGVETFPLPRDPAADQGPGPSGVSPAAAPAQTAGPTPELVVVAQRPDADGEFHEVVIEGEAVLHSWDNFQIRFRVDRPGLVALWHVESQGSIHRVFPADGDASRAATGEWVELPEPGRWFYLDERRGEERFILGWTSGPAPTVETIEGELAGLSRTLAAARRTQSADPTDGLNLRGLGGTREAPQPSQRPDEASLMAAIDGVFAAHYDVVRAVEFKHR